MDLIKDQQDNVKELIKLSSENPDLRIMPMVDFEVCGSDDFRYWAGSFGKVRLEECWGNDERIYFKSKDYENLIEDMMDNFNDDDSLSEEEVEKRSEEYVKKLPWKKVIVVYINTP